MGQQERMAGIKENSRLSIPCPPPLALCYNAPRRRIGSISEKGVGRPAAIPGGSRAGAFLC